MTPLARRPLVPIACCFAIGIVVSHLLAPPVMLVLAVCITLILTACLVLVRRCSQPAQTGVLYLACVATGALTLSVRASDMKRMPAPPAPTRAELVGLVADEPQLLSAALEADKAGSERVEPETRFLLLLDAPPRARAQVIIKGILSDGLKYGDRVRARGLMRSYREARNPGQFDYRDYLFRRGVWAYLVAPDPQAVEIVSRGAGNPVWAAIYAVKSSMRDKVYSLFGQNNGNLFACLVLGDRSRLNPEIEKAFIDTGTVHLLSISGFHVGALAGAIWMLLWLVRVNRRFSAVAVILASWVYAALTGLLPPAVRAAVMLGTFLGGVAIGRESDHFNNLALAGLVILAFNPLEVLSPGFQLSFGAVAAMLGLGPHVETLLSRPPAFPLHEFSRWSRIRSSFHRYVRRSLAYSAAAWLGTAPLVSHHFHIVTPGSLAANMLLMPVASTVIGAGFVMVALALLLPVLAPLGALPLGGLLWLLRESVRLGAALPGMRLYVSALPWPWVGVALALLILFGLRQHLRVSGLHVAVCALFATAIYSVFSLPYPRSPRITFLDVGYGNCVVFEAGGPGAVVVDAGSITNPGVGEFVIAPFLWSRRISRIDVLILSHEDADHCNGVLPLMERFPIGAVVVGPGFAEGPSFQDSGPARILLEARRRAIPVRSVASGDLLLHRPCRTLGDPRMSILWPPRGPLAEGLAPNDRALVLVAELEGSTVLLPSDVGNLAMSQLLREPSRLRAQVMQAPHHGRSAGYVASKFVQTVRPEHIIVSASAGAREDPVMGEGLASEPSVHTTAARGAIIYRMSGGRKGIYGFLTGGKAEF